MDRGLYDRLRRRMLMFYFAAGVNLVMGLWVLAAGVGHAGTGTISGIMLIFLVFAALNFYMARRLKRQWEVHLEEQQRTNQMNG